MFQYLKADFWRLNRRIPRWIILGAALIISAGIIFSSSKQTNYNFVKLGTAMESVFRYLPPLIAMMNLFFVFEDDLEVKTMQIAIGRGTGRFQIIFVKWLEMVILTLTDCIGLFLVMNATGLIRGVTLKGHSAVLVAAQLCTTVLSVGITTALVMIIIFQSMQVGITQILFLLLSLQPISMILNYLESSREFLAKLRLSRFLAGSNLSGLAQTIKTGRFSFSNIAVIMIYIIIGLGITYTIFKKKELDF